MGEHRVHKLVGTIQTADSFFPRLRGLMFRSQWPGNIDGIYFPRCSSVHTCFTWVDLDLVFLDADHRVTGLVEHPRSWRFYNGPKGTVATLECLGGTLRRLDWKVGDEITR